MMNFIQNENGLMPRKGPVSMIAVILLSAFALGLMLTIADFMDPAKTIGTDVACYYNYLPAAFKFQSFEFDKLPLRFGFVNTPEGFVVEKTTMGMAFLYLPFYLIALLVVNLGGLDPFEYGPPFALALALSAIFYFTLGMIFLRKVLLRFFNDAVTTIGLLTIFLGTNMVYYVAYEGPMSHAYVFFLIALLLWLVIKWHEKPRWGTSVSLGLVSGLLTLVRPTTITILLFVALYGIYNRESLSLKMQLVRKNWGKILLIAFVAFLVWVPQITYWNWATGHFLFFSYTGERFFWDQPLIHLGFFSYRNGWLMYSPVMIFSLIGFFFLKKELNVFRWGIILYFLVTVYMIFSWWCWWWVGIGLRAMIELYPLLAIPLCAFVAWVLKRPVIWKTAVMMVFTFLMFFGLFKNWQYKSSLIHFDGMTGPAYWGVFLNTKLPRGYYEMIKSPDYEEARKGNRLNN